MASDTSTEVYDLLILVDATYSMSNYLDSLKASLPKVIAISNLTNSFARIGLLAYRDYSEANRQTNGMLEWSGWYDHKNPDVPGNVSSSFLMASASCLEPMGGGDYPEATKTGLARAYSLMREDATTIILLYTDAPPHCWMVAEKDRRSNYHAEQAALSVSGSYGGYGPNFADWVSACKQLHSGPKKAQVFCFLDQYLHTRLCDSGYYTYLSTVTRGACLLVTKATPHTIAQLTVDVLLAWMGVEKPGAQKVAMPAILVRYKNGDSIKRAKDEKDSIANPYFWAHSSVHPITHASTTSDQAKAQAALEENIAEIHVDSDVLNKYLPKKKTPVADFARRYATDEQYKGMVVEQLKAIIESDVTSMTLNPIFGALWRAVCNDRENSARDGLITAFSLSVDRIANAEEKTRLKNWLEESYDYAAEILDILEKVPEDQRFPCVFLDPTIQFQRAKKKGDKEEEEEEANRPITTFRRDELLEVGRSCDGRILRRLGKVLTRLTYVETLEALPAHIAATTNAEVPKIPIALASKEHGWKFWKILLHVVLPGTMLSARPATVLAALAIRIGLKPLFEPACAAMLFWRDKWNNLEVPETWNASCLGLLLDADDEYRSQVADSGTGEGGDSGLLLQEDRNLFWRLVTYQHISANLLTTLTAKIGWTPDKTQMPVGPIVICRSCKYPRSTTIMVGNSGGKCGLCVANDWTDQDHKKRAKNANVTPNDTEASSATWTECSVRTCRAQYVCYNPSDLNVRPKCHYCRAQADLPAEQRSADPAPTLECTKCLSKVICPKEYRGSATKLFQCVACHQDRQTVVAVETNAEQLSKENGQTWLLRNGNNAIKDPFKRSLFHTVTSTGVEPFLTNVELFPSTTPEPVLTIHGKRLHNQSEVITELKSWIQRRAFEKSLCSLCFDSFPKSRLLPACRRRGCHQQICQNCLSGWYGLNNRGTTLNVSSLFCPFCRRTPSARTLAAYGKGVHAVGDIQKAVEDRGQWIYAWCYDCGKAKPYMERECARGAPDALEQWKCEPCIDTDLERARIAEEAARQALDRATQLDAQECAAAQYRLVSAARLRKELEYPVKECPGCKTPTQKTSGCDHMQCSVMGCKTHWCWVCAKPFAGDKIYRHMDRVHGGWYTGGGLIEDDDDNEEEGFE
jgi:hypothetical protein